MNERERERERRVENKESGRCWVGAWVGGKWRNRNLQREEMKSVRTEERGATSRNGKGGERKKIENIKIFYFYFLPSSYSA